MSRLWRFGGLAVVLLLPRGVDAEVPSGWREQPAVAQRAWGDAALGVFGMVLTAETDQRVRAQDALDGFRTAAAAAGIELGEPVVTGAETVTSIRRGRWRGEARLRGGDRHLELAACFYTDRRPERAERECRAFLAGAAP